LFGTIVNTLVILIGGTLGLLLGNRLPKKTQETIISGLGLITLVLGFKMALSTQNILIVMFSILLGGIWGEAWRLDDHLNALGDRIEKALNKRKAPTEGDDTTEGRSFSRAFVTASLIFSVGPIATLGAIQDGLLGDSGLLLIKSTLDLFASMALSASLGPGVIAAAGTVFVYQGSVSVAARVLGGGLGPSVSAEAPAIIEMTAAGGVIILGIGLDLLNIKTIRVVNLLPAILLAPLSVIVLTYLGVI
jgi:uncharacterized membrane protein YqgA involved in biofilm formation